MVIDNWSLPCKYHIGNLEKTFYIQLFDDVIDYQIDDAGEPICSGISGSLSSITCDSIILSEESNFDTNRFAFKYTLTAKFREGQTDIYSSVLKLLRENEYRIYVKTTEGMYYLVNAEYPYTLNYDYEWSNSNHHCTLTFTCMTNIPTMKCTTFPTEFTELIPSYCGYFSPRVDSFEIIEKDYVKVGYNASELNYTAVTTIGDAEWKTIEHLDDSFVYTHHFDGSGFTDTIRFDIELADYLTTFHYNILEFVKNKYVVRFKSAQGNTLIVGEEYGLFPSFSLNTSEELGKLNTITITLRQSTQYEVKFSSTDIEDGTNSTKKNAGTANKRRDYTTLTMEISGMTFPTVECVSPTMAKRLILPQVGIDGTETGKYYVLEGYEDYYGSISDLILGTFSEETINNFDVSLYIYTNQCLNDFGCIYTTTLNTKNYLVNTNSDFFGIISSCGWEIISKDDCLTFSQMSGEPSVQDMVTYTSSCEEGTEATFTIKVGDDEYEYIVKRVDTTSCFIEDNNVSIVASAVTLTFAMTETANNVNLLGVYLDNNDTDLLNVTLNGYTMTVVVPEYTDFNSYQRQFNITLESINGGYCSVHITQSCPYKKNKIDYSKYECIDGDKYYVYQVYSGYTLNDINTPTGVYTYDPDSAPWERDSLDCTDSELVKWFDAEDTYYCEENPEHSYEKWSASTEYTCDGTDKYAVEYKMVSDDGETWSATTDTRTGDLLAHNSSDCGYCTRLTRWTDNTGETICDGVSLYYVAYQEYSDDCGETWTTTTGTTLGTLISENTVDCGGTGCSETAETMEMWSDVEDETMCSGTSLYYKCYKYTSCTSGRTWERTEEYSAGTLISEDSVQCGGGEYPQYKWEDSIEDTTCYKNNLYYKSYRYRKDTAESEWVATGEWKVGTLIEEGSSQCEECQMEYNWFEIENDYLCDETTHTKYKKLCYYWSDDCWVTRNLIETTAPQRGDVIEYNSYDCGYSQQRWDYIEDTCFSDLPEGTEICDGEEITKWVESSTDTMISGYNMYYKVYEYTSSDCGINWEATGNYSAGTIVEGYVPANNEIWYTTSNETTFTPYRTSAIGTLTSNKYSDGRGVMTFEEDISSIGEMAFMSCSGLTSILMPSSVTSIGDYAFNGCSGLKSIEIPSGVTSIGQMAFNFCTKLKSIEIPDSVTNIGEQTFFYCRSLKSITLGDSVTTIGVRAFNGCSGLTSVIIPDSVTTIYSSAFESCTSLSSITLGNSVTSIGDDAFNSCLSLTSITIPSSVTNIGQQPFWNCTSLTSIISNATTAPTIKSNTFNNISSSGVLYVPSGSDYSTWLTALGDGWTSEEF